MEPSPEQKQDVDVNAVIMGILAEIMAMGANDSERSVIMTIQQEYQEKKISAEEAVKRAEGVRDSKNAYH